MPYLYYHKSGDKAATSVSMLAAYDLEKGEGGTVFDEQQTDLKALVDSGIIVEKIVQKKEKESVVEPTFLEGEIKTTEPMVEVNEISAEEVSGPSEQKDEGSEDSEASEDDEDAGDSAEDTKETDNADIGSEKLLSESELEALPFAKLRLYAREHGVTARARAEFIKELKEVGKVA